VVDTARAGVPPVEKCMLCHQRILVTYPEIEKLRRHYDEKNPPQWARVNSLPEFVYFSHERHVRSGADCGQCHGNIRGMDRVYLVQDFTMGFCVQCHRDNGYSHDCYTCHR
jgi:predicted CXXCH cytochrome family protein